MSLKPTDSPLSESVSSESIHFVWTLPKILSSISLFVAAGLLEVGGGWLVWQTIREHRHWGYALLGVLALIGYGFVPCAQPTADFGRVYAVYGGFFIVLAFAWAWRLDGFLPDIGDIAGSSVALIGVCLIMFWPR